MALFNNRKACRLLKKLRNGSHLVNNVFSVFLFSQLGILSLVLLTKTKTLYFKISSASCITGRIKILLIVFIFSLLTHILHNRYAHDYFFVTILRVFWQLVYFCLIILSEWNRLLLYDDKICKLRAGTLFLIVFLDFPWVSSVSLFTVAILLVPASVVSSPQARSVVTGGCQVSSGPAKSFTHSDSHCSAFAWSQGTTLIIEWLSHQWWSMQSG